MQFGSRFSMLNVCTDDHISNSLSQILPIAAVNTLQIITIIIFMT